MGNGDPIIVPQRKFAHSHFSGPSGFQYTLFGFIYRSNANAWMTIPITMEWRQVFGRLIGGKACYITRAGIKTWPERIELGV